MDIITENGSTANFEPVSRLQFAFSFCVISHGTVNDGFSWGKRAEVAFSFLINRVSLYFYAPRDFTF